MHIFPHLLSFNSFVFFQKSISRETRVALLLRILPHRGPNAFTIFKQKIAKDYPWLAKKLTDELKRLQSGQVSINKRLITTLQTQLVPLVYPENASYEMCDESAHPSIIIQKLCELLTSLQRKCYKALDVDTDVNKTPLHKLIEERLKQDVKKEATYDLEELSKEVRDLKKQLKEAVKLKGENEKMKQLAERQKEKLKDYAKMTRDVKRYKQEIDKYKKEAEMLRSELSSLKEQQKCNIGIASLF